MSDPNNNANFWGCAACSQVNDDRHLWFTVPFPAGRDCRNGGCTNRASSRDAIVYESRYQYQECPLPENYFITRTNGAGTNGHSQQVNGTNGTGINGYSSNGGTNGTGANGQSSSSSSATPPSRGLRAPQNSPQ